jgi:hypothetical protein
MSLLDELLAEECSPRVRELLRAALATRAGVEPRRGRLEFNRFEVAFDLDRSEVVIEDVLDASSSGAQRVSVTELLQALNELDAKPG